MMLNHLDSCMAMVGVILLVSNVAAYAQPNTAPCHDRHLRTRRAKALEAEGGASLGWTVIARRRVN